MAIARRAMITLAILSSIFPRWQDTEGMPANDIPMGCAVVVGSKEVTKPFIATRWEGINKHRSTCRLWYKGYQY